MTNRMQRYFEELNVDSDPDILRAIAEKLDRDWPADSPLAPYCARLLRLHQATNEAHALLSALAEAALCGETALRKSAEAKVALLEELRQQPALLKMLGLQ
jgi:hypothetical protein